MSVPNLTIFGEADQNTLDQAATCLAAEEGSWGVLLPDNHLGYSQPIGMAHGLREHISVSGVGYDIGCGNKAVQLDLLADELQDVGVSKIMDEIWRKIRFGLGKAYSTTDHQVLAEIEGSPIEAVRALAPKAREQLGSVGGGNHYVDLFADDDGYVWIGVHFGSRGFGHSIATYYMGLAQEQAHEDGRPVGKGMMSPPDMLRVDSDAGQEYIEAMRIAGDYAYAGRDVVVEQVREILAMPPITDEIHNHHNFAWREDGYWVVRKGCTPAFPNQRGFVGATMAEDSVILKGTPAADATKFSTIHGAGRQMSRSEAAGKRRRRKRWECNDRDCDYSHTDLHQFDCPDHPDAKPMQRHYDEQKSAGRVDFEAEVRKMEGIELRGGAADEAAPAYKRLDEVLRECRETIDIETWLHPIGVAMAGPGVPRDD